MGTPRARRDLFVRRRSGSGHQESDRERKASAIARYSDGRGREQRSGRGRPRCEPGTAGGNITGLTYVHDMLAGKSVELLKDTVPSVSRVAILWNPNHADPEFRETQRASRTLGVQLQSLEVREPGDLDSGFQAALREQAEALIVIGSRLIFLNRTRIGDFADKNQLVLVGVPSWLIDAGALFTYGPNVPDLLRRASTYIDKPSDLPMQQPTTFELIINQ